jgi:hypothetical protein
MLQLRLFGSKTLKTAHLVAIDSPRQAFYIIWIEKISENAFRVCKESGGRGRVLDRRAWEFGSFDEAEKLFLRRIREKTNHGRKSIRKYRFVHLISQREE